MSSPDLQTLKSPIAEEQAQLGTLLAELGLTAEIMQGVRLPPYDVADRVELVEIDEAGREHRMTPAAAAAWRAMKAAAAADGVALTLVSAFRDLHDQAGIIRDKLGKKMPIQHILTLSVPPGYSEHHTGCAIDINTPGCAEREEPFEQTGAFGWLQRRAAAFGFHLSYPRDNSLGLIYEPWHWCFRGMPVKGESTCA